MTKLYSIEMGRGFAALFVFLFHLEDATQVTFGHYAFQGAFIWGHLGVAYFFALSGFLMMLIHQKDIGDASAVARFALRRAIRILPMLWLVLFSLAFVHVALPSLLRTSFSANGFWADLALIPYPGERTLNPIWTLKREAIFYVLFALMIARPKIGLPIVVTWQALSVLNAALAFWPGYYGSTLFDAYNLGFGAGMIAALAYRRLSPRRFVSNVCVVLGAAGLIAVSAVEWHIAHNLPRAFPDPIGVELEPAIQVVAAALLLYGLLGLERSGRLRMPRWSAAAGGISYTLYLIHDPMISGLNKLAPLLGRTPLANPMVFYLAASVIVLTGAGLTHFLVERPVQNFLHRALRDAFAKTRLVAAQP